MQSRSAGALFIAAVAVLAIAAWWLLRSGREPSAAPASQDTPTSILPRGPATDWFAPAAIGTPRGENDRPRIAHVLTADLDGDGLLDVLACDMVRNRIVWVRQSPRGTYTERDIPIELPAPAQVEAVDFDRDGDTDLVVAVLGVLLPSNNRIGQVVVLENDGAERFTPHVIADRIARVAEARTADFNGDGRLDVTVAGFGYDDGETGWLENRGNWTFEYRILQRLSGAINASVADVNGDGQQDIVALISQDWEEIWAFVNDGKGNFTERLIWGSTNPDYGSSWISLSDMDRDGDADILYSNGDAFDYAPGMTRPWHGVQWLENGGNLMFTLRRIADLPGASSPQAGDLDGDGDLDVAVVSAYNNWADPSAQSLVWLENNGRMQFTMHDIANAPTHQITVSIADLDGDGRQDLVTGGLHIGGPFERIGRLTLWTNGGAR